MRWVLKMFYWTQYTPHVIISIRDQYKNYEWDSLHFGGYKVFKIQCVFYTVSPSQCGLTTLQLLGFSITGQIVGILGFSDQTICHNCSTLPLQLQRSLRQCVNEWAGCVSVKLYLEKQVEGWIWPLGCSLPALCEAISCLCSPSLGKS